MSLKSNPSSKQKLVLVIIFFLILLVALYFKTYKKIFETRHKINELEYSIQNSPQTKKNIGNLKSQLTYVNNIIGSKNANFENVPKEYLNFIANTNFQVELISITKTHFYRDKDFSIYTNQVIFKGDYENLLELLYETEKKFIESRIISAKIYKERNYAEKKDFLYLKIIFQNYESI